MIINKSDSRAGSVRALWIALIAGCAVFALVVVSACAGLLVWGIKSTASNVSDTQVCANSFLDEIQQNRIDSAYAQTSTGFKRNHTPEQFTNLVTEYPALSSHTSRTLGGVSVFAQPGGSVATVQMTVVSSNNSLSFTLSLVQENGQWKVDSISVP